MSEISKVIDNGYCSGCGACAYSAKRRMQLNEYGEYVPIISEKEIYEKSQDLDAVCPFASGHLNETFLGDKAFGNFAKFDEKIGFHLSAYGGFVREGRFRESGTSGGMGSWIGVELMRLGLIDAVIHVKPRKINKLGDPYFGYAISRTVTEVLEGAKSRYHVVEMSEVLNEVSVTPGRYLFIGIPCFAKAIRRIQLIDPLIKTRIPYVVSLVCGHLKSVNWTIMLGWAAGLDPSKVEKFQYRTKEPGISARSYVYRATWENNGSIKTLQKDSSTVTGGKFNAGAMMLNACDYCDDIVGETADLTIGDAWLPRFDHDNQGTNLLIVRNVEIEKILKCAFDEGRIFLDPISAKEASDSQSGAFRHRREGLSYRLMLTEKKGIWVPSKRVKAGDFSVSWIRRAIYRLRVECSRRSRIVFLTALKRNDLAHYNRIMSPLFFRLRTLEIMSSLRRILTLRISRKFQRYKRRFLMK